MSNIVKPSKIEITIDYHGTSVRTGEWARPQANANQHLQVFSRAW